MSVYNGARYLREAIDSVLIQTFSDFEFIILNDGSTDDSARIIQNYGDSRIRYVENSQNMGLTRSLNRGLSMSQGDYIARMDADDISLPDRFAAQVAFLETHSDVGLLGTSVLLIDERGRRGEKVEFPSEHGFLRWLMCFVTNPIIHPTVMVRRSWIQQVGGYDENMITSQDYELWARLRRLTCLSNLAEPLLFLRKHTSNISIIRFKEGIEKVLQVNRQIIEDALGAKVPEMEIRCLWRVVFKPQNATAQEACTAAKLISRLCESHLSNSSLSAREKEMIRRNGDERLRILG
jgi:glycosyltransferase involved in cell wall biosynthesis